MADKPSLNPIRETPAISPDSYDSSQSALKIPCYSNNPTENDSLPPLTVMYHSYSSCCSRQPLETAPSSLSLKYSTFPCHCIDDWSRALLLPSPVDYIILASPQSPPPDAQCTSSLCIPCITHVDQSRVVSVLDVVQHRGFIQARQLGHVLHLVELGRIHLLDVVPQDHHPLARLRQLHFHLIAALALDAGSHEALELK